MTSITAPELALAFNTVNTRKTWNARPSNTLVIFNPGVSLIALTYDTVDGTWQVRFNKYQAAWGDYVKAIARTFYVVLSTLKQAGLPFAAPDSPEGIDIVTSTGPEGSIYVRYEPPAPATSFDAIMPELRQQYELAGEELQRIGGVPSDP